MLLKVMWSELLVESYAEQDQPEGSHSGAVLPFEHIDAAVFAPLLPLPLVM